MKLIHYPVHYITVTETCLGEQQFGNHVYTKPALQAQQDTLMSTKPRDAKYTHSPLKVLVT